jgi:cell division septal protein FtsQ
METDPKVIEEIVWGNSPENILKIDLDLLKELLEQEKWVKNVEIRRVLPSGLVIYIQERIPSVILEINDQLMLADNDGILLDRYEPRYGRMNVPIFKGTVGKDPDSYSLYQEENTVLIRHALNMLAEIESEAPQYLDMISEVNISNRNNYIIMFVDDTVEFQIGKEDYRNRLQKLSSDDYREFRKRSRNIATIDLRPKNNQIRYTFNRKVSGSPDQ